MNNNDASAHLRFQVRRHEAAQERVAALGPGRGHGAGKGAGEPSTLPEHRPALKAKLGRAQGEYTPYEGGNCPQSTQIFRDYALHETKRMLRNYQIR